MSWKQLLHVSTSHKKVAFKSSKNRPQLNSSSNWVGNSCYMSPSQKKAAFKSPKNRPQLNSSSSSNWILFSMSWKQLLNVSKSHLVASKNLKNRPQLNSSSNWILFSYELETAFTCLQVKKRGLQKFQIASTTKFKFTFKLDFILL